MLGRGVSSGAEGLALVVVPSGCKRAADAATVAVETPPVATEVPRQRTESSAEGYFVPESGVFASAPAGLRSGQETMAPFGSMASLPDSTFRIFRSSPTTKV